MALERARWRRTSTTPSSRSRRDDDGPRPRLPALRAVATGATAVSLSFMRRDPETPNGLTEFLDRHARSRRSASADRGGLAELRRVRAPADRARERARARRGPAARAGPTRGSRSRASTASTPSSTRAGSRATSSTRAGSALPAPGSRRPGPRARSRSRWPADEAASAARRRGAVVAAPDRRLRPRGRRAAAARVGALSRRRAAARARGAELGRGLGGVRPRAGGARGGRRARIPPPLPVDARLRRSARRRARVRCVVRRADLRRGATAGSPSALAVFAELPVAVLAAVVGVRSVSRTYATRLKPPSTISVCPRTISASGELRNETAPAMSSGRDEPAGGVRRPISSISSRFGK